MGKGTIMQNVKEISFIYLQIRADAALQHLSENQHPTNPPMGKPQLSSVSVNKQ